VYASAAFGCSRCGCGVFGKEGFGLGSADETGSLEALLLAWQRMSEVMTGLLCGVQCAAGMQREARNRLSATKDK
jgi:hypothetical protein